MVDSHAPGVSQGSSDNQDYFMEQDGIRFAGAHLLIEFWGASHLKDPALVTDVLRKAAERSGATIVDVHSHVFSSGGVTGIAILEESHISIHTWPECDLAAIDIFMCGNCRPHAAIEPLKEAFLPKRIELAEHKRGILS
jgi:S-adenosylmethionine decarboxylase